MALPNLLVTHGIKCEINTALTAETPTWTPLCTGFDNISEALNEVIQQYFFLCAKGFASNYVTGMAPVFTLTGRRVLGDVAQEFIFSKKYKTMSNRETQIKITRLNGEGVEESVSCDCTMQNIQEYGGATNDGAAVSVEFAFNGEPTLETKAKTGK